MAEPLDQNPTAEEKKEAEESEENGIGGGENEDENGGEDEEYEEEEEKGERKSGVGPPLESEKVERLLRRLSSGPVRLRVHDVVIRGNAKTKDSVIEAEVLDAFRSASTMQELLQAAGAANERLGRLDVFDSVSITLDAGPPELPGTANVIIDVVEAKNPLTGDIGIFTKPEEFDLRGAFPLGFYNSALNIGVAAGVILPWGRGFMDLPSPLPERFYMGGHSSPVCNLSGPTSLLGFRTRGLGPTDSRRFIPTKSDKDDSPASPERDVLGGDLAVTAFADLSFDLPLKLFRESGIHGHVFINAGNLAKLTENKFKDFSFWNFWESFRSSVGFGIIFPTKLFRMEMYRSKKIDESGQVIADPRSVMKGTEQHKYNLGHLSMLQGCHQRSIPNSRSDGSSWVGHRNWTTHDPVLSRAMNSTVGSRLSHGPITEMIFRGSERLKSNQDFHINTSSLNHQAIQDLREATGESQLIHNCRVGTTQYRAEEREEYLITELQERGLANDQGPDLNLSLNIGPRQEKKQRRWEEELDISLSLSLFGSSRMERCSRDVEKASNHGMWEEEVGSDEENTRGTSTLDLTI
ncbi:putative Outer membrane OMP85 family protein [Cocos nucifera]|nr:putative Outer membrane OMP85 family protein [Cocos nucifera]